MQRSLLEVTSRVCIHLYASARMMIEGSEKAADALHVIKLVAKHSKHQQEELD
jgi:hypothetical protein